MKSKIIKVAGLVIVLAFGLVIIMNGDFIAQSFEDTFEEQDDPYCEEGLKQVKQYAEEIIPVLDQSFYNLAVWLGSKGEKGDISVLINHADQIEEINKQYSGNNFPSREEMETWIIKSDEQGEKTVEGKYFASAVWGVKNSSMNYAELLKELVEALDGVYDIEKMEDLNLGPRVRRAINHMENLHEVTEKL